jgi:hypothetical protein
MNEDYLWDKSGEPDPEIQQLEQTLGSLRYKRPVKPLELPPHATARPWYGQGFSPALAIAATLVALILAGGLWLGLRRANPSNGSETVATRRAPDAIKSPQSVSGPSRPVGPIEIPGSAGARDVEKRPDSSSATRHPLNRINRRAPSERQEIASLTENTMRLRREQRINREGELAKEQLIKALLITSDKLNAVQKKIQGNQERGPIS